MRTTEATVGVTGSIALDQIKVYPKSLLEYLSDLHPNFSVSLLVESLALQRGGNAANIAYTMALLGEHPVLLGSVGSEDHAYIETLSQMGVDTSRVHFSKKLHTPRFDVVTDKDNNQFATFYPGAMMESSSLSVAFLRGKDAVVIIAPHDPAMMLTQVRECKANGIRFCFDIGQQVNNATPELLREGVESCELLIVNEHELSRLAQQLNISVEELKEAVPICITTLGKDGSLIEGRCVNQSISIKAAKIPGVVDPTGAGDAYRAGFFSEFRKYRLNELTPEILRVCGQYGSIAAAYAVEHMGGQTHEFTLGEFQQRYEKNFGKIQTRS